MMIKIFTSDKDGKIALSPAELKSLLDEAYWEGYRARGGTITYTTPDWKPYTWANSTITLNTVPSDGPITTDHVITSNMRSMCTDTAAAEELS